MTAARDDLAALVAASIERVNAMSPEEKEAMLKAQAESFARAEIAFGSDADEAKTRAAFLKGDTP